MRIDWRRAALAALFGFISGIAYRHFFDLPEEASLINYARSGIHAAAITLVGWFAHLSFGRWPGGRLPLAVAAALLQGVLYGEWLRLGWLADTLPMIVASAFAGSLVFASAFELSRL